jgi:hypothetical protein
LYDCPHCGKPTISAWRKATLGPALPTTCSACDENVGVPWGKSSVAMLPFFAALLLPLLVIPVAVLVFGEAFLETLPLLAVLCFVVGWMALLAVATTASVLLYLWWVPFERR